MLTNWAGNVEFAAHQRHEPTSVSQLREIVRTAPRLRPLGTAHSFSPIADTTGDQVFLARLPPDLDIDSNQGTARVAAGLRYGDIVARLHADGWALANLGSLPHISIAGACATGTHGSGDANGCLATAVAGLELVTTDGELSSVDNIAGAAVGLGALGIVTHVTLRLRPAFDIAQYVYDGVAWPDGDEGLTELFGAGYSVSLFTNWDGGAQVWVKRIADDTPPPRSWLGGELADGPRHPVPGIDPAACTEQLGRPGPWYQRLPHFRLEFIPSAGDELQSEFLVPRERALEAFAALREIGGRIAPVLHISEVRTVAADDLWLSPAYGRDSVALHFTWIRDVDAVLPVLAEVESRLDPLAARPHWGKLFTLPMATVRSRYERFDDFVELARRYDPDGKLRNAWLDALIG